MQQEQEAAAAAAAQKDEQRQMETGAECGLERQLGVAFINA